MSLPASTPTDLEAAWNAQVEGNRQAWLQIQDAARDFASRVPQRAWHFGHEYVLEEVARALDEAGLARHIPAKITRRKLSPGKRRKVLERNAYRCVQCDSYQDLHIDHVVALANGGTDDLDNLQTLCGVCNMRKGDR